MQYLSPIRLFEYSNIDYSNPDTGRIKKILSVEFSLSENGIISIDDFDYSKNDIFEELQNENFLQRLEFHKQIWKEKSLLSCLEKNEVSLPKAKEWMLSGVNNPEFISFISPYFATSFDKIMRKFLNPADFLKASEWMDYLVFVNHTEDEETALSGIRLFISEFVKTLKNVNKTTYKTILPQLTLWIKQPCYLFINKLPSSLYKYTDDLVRALINFTVRIQFVDKKLCYQTSSQLVRITNTSSELSKLIRSNHSIYKNAYSIIYISPTTKLFKWGPLIFMGIFVITIILIGVLNPSDKTKNKNTKIIEEISTEHYVSIREKYSHIYPDSLKLIQEEPVFLDNDVLYYLMVENKPSHKNSALKLKNNSQFPITVFITDNVNEVLYLDIDPSSEFEIAVNKPYFDFIFRIKKSGKISLKKGMAVPILVSDSLNLSQHKVNLDDVSGREIDLGNSKDIHNFTLTITTYLNAPELLRSNYLIVDGDVKWAIKE